MSREMIDFLTDYCFFDEKQNTANNNDQVPTAYSKYADAAMESLLVKFLPTIEENTGLSLYPTYSYYRIYRNGDILFPHKDRPACEISATLCINNNYNNYNWPIYMDEAEVILNPGDLLIYRGCDVEHWREELVNNDPCWHIQSFLHYVDLNNVNADWKYDKRESLGIRHVNQELVSSQKSSKKYIIYT